MHRKKFVCCHCLKSGKGYSWTCGTQGHAIMGVGDKIRFPSPKASKKEWLAVFENTNLGTNPYFKEKPEYKILLESVNNLK